MKVYIDLIILIDIFFDTLIILGVALLFNYHLNLKKIILANLIGSLAILFSIFNINKYLVYLLSLLISVFMVLVSFGKKNILTNLFYFYMFAIILGGLGNIFTVNKYYQNLILLLLCAPLIIILYIRQEKKYQYYLNKIYDVIIIDDNKTYKFNGFRDTGNNLIYQGIPVIMINNKYFNKNNYFNVKCNVLNNVIDVKCVYVDKVIIDGVIIQCLIGLVDNNIFNKDYDVILNENLKGIYL